ncbi:MAG: hypothetical protein ACFE0O_07575 [Opitutales bacterium]
MKRLIHTACSLTILTGLGLLTLLSQLRLVETDLVTAMSLFALYGCFEVGLQSYRVSREMQIRLHQLPASPEPFSQAPRSESPKRQVA